MKSHQAVRRLPLLVAAAGIALAAYGDSQNVGVGPASAQAGVSATMMNFPLQRSADPGFDVHLQFHTQDGSAVAGIDYTGATGAATLPTGLNSAFIPITLLPGSGASSDLDFSLVLDSIVGTGPAAAFASLQSISSGDNAGTMVAVDINGDGRPDLITSFLGDQDVLVQIDVTPPGASKPVFVSQTFDCGGEPDAMMVADINGDGRADIATVNNGSGTMSVMLNITVSGSTTAAFATPQTFALGQYAEQGFVVDLNGDGRPDVIVGTDRMTGSYQVFLNSTSPGSPVVQFAAPQSFQIGQYAVPALAADLDGDGRPDLVFDSSYSSRNSIIVLLNTTAPGDSVGHLATPQILAAGTGASALAVADINGDGRLDLLVGGSPEEVLINATPAGSSSLQFNPTTVASQAACGNLIDFNGDGKPDLVELCTGTQYQVKVQINTTVPGAVTPSFADPQAFSADQSDFTVIAADFNGDGLPDLALGNRQPDFNSILINTARPNAPVVGFAAANAFAAGSSPSQLAVADFNGDGKPDATVADFGGNTVSVLAGGTNPGDASASFAARQSFVVGAGPTDVVSADLNNDGKPDLVVVDQSTNGISVLLNTTATGATSFQFAAAANFAVGSVPACVAVADLNHDGLPDLIITNSIDNTVSVLLNTMAPGASVASFAAQQTFAAGPAPYAVAVADLNGDGLPDLAVSDGNDNAGQPGAVSVLLSTTTPGSAVAGFAAAHVFSSGDAHTHALAIADVDHDGRPDLIAVNQDAGGSVSVLLNRTVPGSMSSSFAAARSFTVGGSPSAVTVADLNGDGYPDLLVSNQADNTVSVLINGGTPDAATPVLSTLRTIASGSQPSAVAAVDLNGDGQPDLLVTDRADNRLSVAMNTRYAISLGTRTATGTIEPDITPAPFTFDAADAPPATVQTSNAVTVSGIAAASPISIAGGRYNINGGTYTNAAGFANNGDVVTVQLTSSPDIGSSTRASLTVGGVSAAFVVTTVAPDVTPDAFNFDPVTNAMPGDPYVSNMIIVSGIDVPTPIGVSGGYYKINGGAYTQAAGVVNAGDVVAVLVPAASFYSATVVATLMIGTDSADFVVTTEALSATPENFSFAPVNGASPGQWQFSNPIRVAGIDVPVPISVSGGTYSINRGPYVSMPGTVRNGDSVTVSLMSPASGGATSVATLAIGSRRASFSVSTAAVPDQAGSGGGGAFGPGMLFVLAGLALLRRRPAGA